MNKNLKRSLLAWALLAGAGCAGAVVTTPGKQIEHLGRGVVAVANPSGKPFVSWRALATDQAGTLFNVYRDGVKLNPSPLVQTNWTDNEGAIGTSTYTVRPVVNGVERPGHSAKAWSANHLRIPIEKPAGGVTQSGVSYTYTVGDGTPVDLDGDGEYEIVFLWTPSNSKDPSQDGYTPSTYIDAYKLDGTRMWRIDLGRNIRSGAHYTPFIAYDLDGDGQGEVMVRTADGTIDGEGKVIGSATADHRNAKGRPLSGPEYLTVFNGLTGAAMQTVDYIPPRGNVLDWGDDYGNRVDRFLAGVANLDGSRPSAVFARGYYTRAVIAAWDWRDGRLSSRWVFDSDIDGRAARGQGAHWFSVADVDSDGKDDIVYGAATISSYGKLMYATGLGHGDALHVGKFQPRRPGLQYYMVHEAPGSYGGNGSAMHDAATGALLWGASGAGKDVGRGVCLDIDPAYAGVECWASVGGLYSSSGTLINATAPQRFNFGLWWDGGLERESLDGDRIERWNPASNSWSRLFTGYQVGAYPINGTKNTPVVSADLMGDWREEVVFRSLDHDALLVFSTAYPTTHRLPTLMHNPQYRAQVAGQPMGYNQPPHPSFFLGFDMDPVVQEAVHIPFEGNGTFQAETAIVAGGTAVRRELAGYRGTGYLSFPASGGSAQYSRINGGSGGVKTISLRFANGDTMPRHAVLRVNGIPRTIVFLPTGAWNSWRTVTAEVRLNPGMSNTLRLESFGHGLANIDEITVP